MLRGDVGERTRGSGNLRNDEGRDDHRGAPRPEEAEAAGQAAPAGRAPWWSLWVLECLARGRRDPDIALVEGAYVT